MQSFPDGKLKDFIQCVWLLCSILASVSFLPSSFFDQKFSSHSYNYLSCFYHFRALEHINTNRKNIEMELKELLKLCQWERSEIYLSMENSKRTQQKLRKLIQKYTVSDILYFFFSYFVFVCLFFFFFWG